MIGGRYVNTTPCQLPIIFNSDYIYFIDMCCRACCSMILPIIQHNTTHYYNNNITRETHKTISMLYIVCSVK